ncbi:MAG: HIT family protein [Actinomycetota bacterium]|nr:HIT family protein [Actinomycetota bacterium]
MIGLDRSVQLVCETRSWLAFFPDEPATPGHTLVVPRRHVTDLWEATTDEAVALTAGAVRVGRSIQAVLNPDGMNLITSAGRAAEQSVFHLHLHVVPRWRRDGFGQIWPKEHRYEDAALTNVAGEIRAVCQEGERDGLPRDWSPEG